MRAFNKKKKPKHTTKFRYTFFLIKLRENTYGKVIEPKYSLNVFTESKITNSEFFEGMYHQTVFKLGRMSRSRTCGREL